jgi:hypothetical protein
MQIVEVDVPVEVQQKVQRFIEVPVDKLVCNNVQTVQKRVEVERCIWKEVPVEKVIEKKVESCNIQAIRCTMLMDDFQVPVTVDKIVEREKIVYVDFVVLKEVPVEQIIEEVLFATKETFVMVLFSETVAICRSQKLLKPLVGKGQHLLSQKTSPSL